MLIVKENKIEQRNQNQVVLSVNMNIHMLHAETVLLITVVGTVATRSVHLGTTIIVLKIKLYIYLIFVPIFSLIISMNPLQETDPNPSKKKSHNDRHDVF